MVRYVKLLNEVRPMANAIKRGGEVKQNGVGKTWWEKSAVLMARVRDHASHAVKATWRKLLDVTPGPACHAGFGKMILVPPPPEARLPSAKVSFHGTSGMYESADAPVALFEVAQYLTPGNG